MRRLHRRVSHGDAGFTLPELLVSMLLLTSVLIVFTGAFIGVETGVRKTSSLASAQQQSRDAYQLLDREVRYANAVNDPTVANGSTYIEFQLGDSPTTSYAQTCYQWRVTSTSQLQWRSFALTNSGTAVGAQTPSNPLWRTVATGLDTSANPVFTTNPASPTMTALEPAGNGANLRQVAVLLRVRDGGHPGGSASTQALFTAANTTTAAAPVTPVCQQAGRP